ncbi:hypothetical protein BRADI_3g59863v3 [Brachypodium distachyon]|uniref:Uncharacterized protein n=1 Tax=Brachypodium distachyon TaxID=15368 RepID=A0A0Q3MCJ0_BRADI|nr:hypothetical protein BRADI_3g59863v3 [Brachypodium distachyon]
MCRISCCFGGDGGKEESRGAPAAAAHPRYVPRRGQVLRTALGTLLSCWHRRPARTQPLPL